MYASNRVRSRAVRTTRAAWLASAAVLALIAALFTAARPAHAAPSLLSQGRTATASSTENAGTPASAAVDGNTGTRWSSAAADPQWLQVDLGATATLSSVTLNWESAYATAYKIQVSDNATTWTDAYSTTTATGGVQTVPVNASGRYVRFYGTARATGYGYSLWEFQVYGTSGTTGPTACGTDNAALDRPATASSTENAGTPPAAAVDGNTGTRWSSAAADPQWLQVDLGSSVPVCQVVLNWEAAYATAFQIQLSDNGTTWTPVYSTTTGTGGVQTLTVTGTGRYVRVNGSARATGYGYSLWEFQVRTGGSGTSGGGTGGTTGGTGTGTGDCGTANAALGHPATASSLQDGDPGYSAVYGVDGSTISRWSSASSDPQWFQVDLGASLPVCRVVINWENAYAKAFQIQLSDNGTDWRQIYSTTTGPGGKQSIDATGSGRYIRMYGTARATAYGYALWEFEVYTVGGVTATIPPPPSQPAPGSCPWLNSTAATSTRVAQLMGQMSLQQKVAMLHGTDAPDYIGKIIGNPALCIPDVNFEDGPAGVGDGLGGVTQMPSGMVSAATFDPQWQQSYGDAVGQEFAGKGVHVALGPTVNIIRDPRWGRSYETFGEDPYLSGQMGAADIRGIQEQGVMAEVKHAAAYNIEQPAGTVNVDARTLQEIYLPAFQTAIKEGGAAAVMCAYSNVNNEPSCQNPDILNKGLYQQAGFTGFVTSDWGAIHSTVESANAGLTVEMPGGYYYADFLIQAVQDGRVSQATVDTMVSRVLTQMFRFGMFDKAPTGDNKAIVTTPAHNKVALQGVEEGTVLLKNNGVLPLNPAALPSGVAVIGTDAGPGTQTIGGGSGTVTSSGTYTPVIGIQQRLADTGTKVTYDEGTDVTAAANLARASSVAVVFASDNYGHEEADNASLNLPGGQDALISAVAAANPHTIVVLNNNSAILMPWLNQVAGVFEGFYDGQQYGQGIAALLFGDVNPSGHLPVTFPASLSQVPANTAAQWPGTNGQVNYSEGLKVGYRWYDTNNLTPLFPFGFGLSYTSFSFGSLQVGAVSGGQATVKATVTNTGSRAGTEVAQLYVADPGPAGEPPHQLKGFQRISLAAGASGTVTFTVPVHALASWSTTAGHWVADAGTYQILVGDSSRNLPLSGSVTLPSAVTAD
ncbi:discoidin domain-containing protein [Streptomyces sp. NBC_01477]|uniref:discoidin domain-containing protein n=1 Tax=Streptomyces sp. NBC_01477 TaxID=2976015 RepID=UPI002E3130EE|nr:discoidin domain-containing protein [Streptomyces sp. NBC_01477]